MGSFFSRVVGSSSSSRKSDIAFPADNVPDTVYLYQFPRWALGPNQSMPCLRVEAYLRLHKIPHVVVPTMRSGPLGRWPWARYNGAVLTDSQLIIDHIAEARGIDDGAAYASDVQRGAALAVERMLDFHVYPYALRWLWVDNFPLVRRFSSVGPATAGQEARWRREAEGEGGAGQKKGLFARCLRQLLTFGRYGLESLLRRRFIAYLNGGGWGEYDNEEYRRQWVADVQAIARILGDKPFLFGDHPTRTDASVYAFLQPTAATAAGLDGWGKSPSEAAAGVLGGAEGPKLSRPPVLDGLAPLFAEGAPLRAYLSRIEARLYPDAEALCHAAASGVSERERYPPALTM